MRTSNLSPSSTVSRLVERPVTFIALPINLSSISIFVRIFSLDVYNFHHFYTLAHCIATGSRDSPIRHPAESAIVCTYFAGELAQQSRIHLAVTASRSGELGWVGQARLRRGPGTCSLTTARTRFAPLAS